jgi:hypothetical protein
MPKLAIVPPNLLSFGRRILISSAVSFDGRRFAPASIMLLWEYFLGSEKATQTASLASISSTKRLSWLTRSIFDAVDGKGTLAASPASPTACSSLLRGGLTDPVNPAKPYDAESANLSLGEAAVLLPESVNLASFFPKGCLWYMYR